DQGVLVFEKPTGGPDHGPAAEVARILAAAEVPVVVLNACQSGAVGKQLTALSLFQNVTDLDVLSRLQDLAVPQRFHGQTVDDWAQALDEAAGAELLSPVGNVMYRIHPALPA